VLTRWDTSWTIWL